MSFRLKRSEMEKSLQYRFFDYAQNDSFKVKVTHSTCHIERNAVESKYLIRIRPLDFARGDRNKAD